MIVKGVRNKSRRNGADWEAETQLPIWEIDNISMTIKDICFHDAVRYIPRDTTIKKEDIVQFSNETGMKR